MPALSPVSPKLVPFGWAIRLATEGVKPGVVERWTLYRLTPTLSVAAPHETFAVEIAPTALSVPGALGALVSGVPMLRFMSDWISAWVRARL